MTLRASPHLSAPFAAAALVAMVAVACRSTEERAPDPGKKSLTAEELQRLIAQGEVRPVEPGLQAPAAADPTASGDPAASADPAAPGDPATPVDPAAQADANALVRAQQRLDEIRRSHGMSAGTPSIPGAAAALAPVEAENPYLLFGKRIEVYPQSGLIMKPYPLRAGTGRTLAKLVQDYGNFPVWQPGGEPQKSDQVRMELVERWDQELFSDMRQSVPTEDKVLPVADWLIVVAGSERLKEVESFINIFAASIPQIEIEAKIVEVVVSDSLDYGVTPIDETTPIFGFPDSAFVKSFNYNLPNSAGSGLGAINSFLTLGGVQDGFAFNAVLQALATYENVSIVSSPKIAVREGVRAQFVNTLKIPSLNVTGLAPDGRYLAGIVYDEVGIKLYVIPRVVGTQTVGLNIDIEASAQAGTAVTLVVRDPNDPTAPGQTISNPIISRRAAQTVVYLEPGQAVILGGLVSERTVDAENKVPLLGDIPIVGYLFKSVRKRKEKTNVLFFIRPRILQGTDLNREF